MLSHIRYAKIVSRHKWFVFIAGLKLNVPLWRLIIHDWSKFTPAEWGGYRRRFGSGRAGQFDNTNDPMDFHKAWTHHWHCQPHHWEHWLRIVSPGGVVPMEIPETYIREMVADWMGAGRAYTGHWDIKEWFATNRNRITLHAATRDRVETLVAHANDLFT